MTKHTAKLPVRIYHYYQDHGDYWQINDKYNNYLAICKDAESAALLLRCCNSHEALVESLKHCVNALEYWFDRYGDTEGLNSPLLTHARSALKLAEGRE